MFLTCILYLIESGCGCVWRYLSGLSKAWWCLSGVYGGV